MDPDLLRKAAGPGRIRGFGTSILGAAMAHPHRAGATLRHGLRDARALHSRERRLVAEVLYAAIRLWGRLDHAGVPVTAMARWDAILVHLGVPADAFDAAPWLPRCVDLAVDDAPDPLAAWAGVPSGVAEELRRAFGDNARAFVDASARRAPVVLRPGRTCDRAALAAAFAARGVEARAGTLVSEAVLLPPGTPTHELPGPFEVQDEASQWVAARVAALGGRVLDACAGAGGKSLALADAGCEVTAVDVRGSALEELQRRAKAAGVRVRTVHRPDGVLGGLGAFPVVLVDAPCSGTGTWRRHPELRWRLDGLDGLVVLQTEILDRAAACVAVGGALAYATCSVLPRENEDQVSAFLRRNPGFQREDSRSTSPHVDGTDGFFLAVLRRK